MVGVRRFNEFRVFTVAAHANKIIWKVMLAAADSGM